MESTEISEEEKQDYLKIIEAVKLSRGSLPICVHALDGVISKARICDEMIETLAELLNTSFTDSKYYIKMFTFIKSLLQQQEAANLILQHKELMEAIYKTSFRAELMEDFRFIEASLNVMAATMYHSIINRVSEVDLSYYVNVLIGNMDAFEPADIKMQIVYFVSVCDAVYNVDEIDHGQSRDYLQTVELKAKQLLNSDTIDIFLSTIESSKLLLRTCREILKLIKAYIEEQDTESFKVDSIKRTLLSLFITVKWPPLIVLDLLRITQTLLKFDRTLSLTLISSGISATSYIKEVLLVHEINNDILLECYDIITHAARTFKMSDNQKRCLADGYVVNLSLTILNRDTAPALLVEKVLYFFLSAFQSGNFDREEFSYFQPYISEARKRYAGNVHIQTMSRKLLNDNGPLDGFVIG